jgi:hypothetical protein
MPRLRVGRSIGHGGVGGDRARDGWTTIPSSTRPVNGHVVGRHLNRPDQAVVLCMDETSQIQALDCTQPSLPPPRAGQHDDP